VIAKRNDVFTDMLGNYDNYERKKEGFIEQYMLQRERAKRRFLTWLDKFASLNTLGIP
jgi:hypothetical protein